MTALPPEERPPGRPDPSDSPSASGASSVARQPGRESGCPTDEVLELLANLVAFEASFEAHDLRRPARGHPLQSRRWRREREVLMLQRQMLRLRVDALPSVSFAPFPRPVV